MLSTLKFGILFTPDGTERCAQIKSTILGARKKIFVFGNHTHYETSIRIMDIPAHQSGDVRCRIYTLKTNAGDVLMTASPNYSYGYDPDVDGWPICHAPQVDHAYVEIKGRTHLLTMHNRRNYTLATENGTIWARIYKNTFSVKWTISISNRLSPELICGLYIFCRYLERENEFIVI